MLRKYIIYNDNVLVAGCLISFYACIYVHVFRAAYFYQISYIMHPFPVHKSAL